MLYIVDGMSRAGKSTAVADLVKRFKPLLPVESFRWRPNEMGPDIYWAHLIEALHPKAADPFKLWIADRLHGSEYVYGIHDRREFPLGAWYVVDQMLASEGAFQAVCFLSDPETYKRCAESGRPLEGHPQNIRALWKHYAQEVTTVPYQFFAGDAQPGVLAEKLFMYGLKMLGKRSKDDYAE